MQIIAPWRGGTETSGSAAGRAFDSPILSERELNDRGVKMITRL